MTSTPGSADASSSGTPAGSPPAQTGEQPTELKRVLGPKLLLLDRATGVCQFGSMLRA